MIFECKLNFKYVTVEHIYSELDCVILNGSTGENVQVSVYKTSVNLSLFLQKKCILIVQSQ